VTECKDKIIDVPTTSKGLALLRKQVAEGEGFRRVRIGNLDLL